MEIFLFFYLNSIIFNYILLFKSNLRIYLSETANIQGTYQDVTLSKREKNVNVFLIVAQKKGLQLSTIVNRAFKLLNRG